MTDDITSTVRPAPPVGGFGEVDGRRIFVHRPGSGGPAVVFLPGASAAGLDYFRGPAAGSDKTQSPLPSGPVWMYIAIVTGATATTAAATLIPMLRTTRERPITALAR
ncbi:hypothetical protein P3102_10895 [Amycolatopsis sp. QT-25]|uniref:hypothetical protein n=1 Tax=Amycolatopsis sp. QT-25 TaxID=3034022 RepID=UPI0023ED5D5B|nr:hypothetical protein [Amycolatopsis sp. QT-25]WET81670.1 hypothetical protein P3102_10895 [Amycolatopsis sp. QT-25]